MAKLRPVQAFVVTRAPIVEKDGTASWDFLKILQAWSSAISNALNQIGQFIGVISADATISSRADTIGAALSRINTGGIIPTDNLTDGTGSPLAGGATAFAALVNSSPTTGNALIYKGTDWGPGAAGAEQLIGDVLAGPGTGVLSSTVVATHLSAPLPVTQGGTGKTSPTLIGGANISISGDWPNQTVTSVDTGITELTGDVTAGPGSGSQAASVVATHLTAPLPIAQGGTGTATPSLIAGDNVTITGSWPNQTVAAPSTTTFGTGAPSGTAGEASLYFDTTASPYVGYVFHSSAWTQFS